MSKNKIKQEKAITLIALVVSIIVLLILAGVSIAVLTGENGIINRASSAKTTNEEAEIMENIRLAYNNAQIGKYAGKNENFANIMKSNLEKTYGTGDNNVKVDDNGDNTYTVTIRGRKYNVAANGNVTRKNGVTIGERVTKLKNGDTALVTASVDPGITGTISWKSSDDTIVKVTGSGTNATIEGMASSGSAIITAYIAGTTHEDKFTVNIAQAITAISASAISIGTGETATIVINTTPNSGILEDITYTFTSNNTGVATVDEDGVVTGAGVGNTKITIHPSNGLSNIDCNVEVTQSVGKFQTVVTNSPNQGDGVAYYYTGTTPQPGTSTTTAIDANNMGQYLGMKVNYTPGGYLTIGSTTVGQGENYRVFYIDVAGKYGKAGTIYLKAEADGNTAALNSITDPQVSDIATNFNKEWSQSAYASSPAENMTYVNKLLNKNIWSVYKDTAGIANYVIGAPDLEMWVDGYNKFLNKNLPTSGTYYAHNYTVTANTNGTGTNSGKGYYIGINDAYGNYNGYSTASNTMVSSSSYTSGSAAEDRVKAWNNGGYYWLASPSANVTVGGNNMLMCAYCTANDIERNLVWI